MSSTAPIDGAPDEEQNGAERVPAAKHAASVRRRPHHGPRTRTHGEDDAQGAPSISVRDGFANAALHHAHGVENCPYEPSGHELSLAHDDALREVLPRGGSSMAS